MHSHVTLCSLLGPSSCPSMSASYFLINVPSWSCKHMVRPMSLIFHVYHILTFPAALSASDVEHCSDKYWSMVTDPILSLDAAMVTILLAHVGLTIGTLARHLHRRPDLEPLVNRLLRFDTVGIYLLTERGHGLDAFNVETTATKTSQGFIINTPREEASKSVHSVIQFS